MCGFGGYFSANEDISMPGVAQELGNLLVHRGGDGTGCYKDSASLIVHQRLAIRGLDDSGFQPKQDDNGNVLAYNGELYNVPYLAQKLGLRKEFWEKLSDTEVLFRFIVHFGCESIHELEGTFSFIFYNKFKKEVILVRDRLGVKPLFYHYCKSGNLFFCSEIYPLLKAFNLSKSICQQSLSEYLWFGSCFADRTIFQSIKSVLPGECIVANGDGLQRSFWYKIEDDIHSIKSNSNPASSSVKQAISDAVSRQIVSDVPVSMFLSSGLDSNILLNEVSKLKTNSFVAHTAVFENSNLDENTVANKHAEICGVQHKSINIRFHDVEMSLRTLVKVYGEPFGDAAAIPLYLMCQSLRSTGRKVVLQGDGGDELFLGYQRYIIFYQNYYYIMRFLSTLIPSAFLNMAKLKRVRRWKSILKSPENTQFALALTLHEKGDNPLQYLRHRRLSEDNLSVDPFHEFKNATSRFQSISDKAKKLSFVDLTLQLPSQFLTKVDRSSMAANVEARVPFLDEKVLRASLPLSSRLNIKFLKGKQLLRIIFNMQLPKNIINGKKIGFSTPYIQWIQNLKIEGKLEKLSDQDFCDALNLSAVEIERLLAKSRLTNSDYFMLWKLYVLLIWYQEVLID